MSLPVKRAYAIALTERLPIVPSAPLEASVTLLEATTPVKLPAMQRPPAKGVRNQTIQGPYFNVGSADAGAPVSKPPAYPTREVPDSGAKLQ